MKLIIHLELKSDYSNNAVNYYDLNGCFLKYFIVCVVSALFISVMYFL